MPLDNYITLSQLTKSVKGLVNKINGEATVINGKIGNLANLNTSAKTDLVAAINEVATSSGGSGITQVNADWNATSGVAEILNKPTIPNVSDWALSSSKPTYTASEVGALPDTTTIPTKTSDLTNDSNFLNSNTIRPMVGGSGYIIHKQPYSLYAGQDAGLYYGKVSNESTQYLQIGYSDDEDGAKGQLKLSNAEYSAISQNYTTITPSANSGIIITLPSTSGTLALKSEIPTVSSWALSSTKPTYTASEVGALPDTTVIPAAQVNSDWNATSGVAQILNKPTIPAATTVVQTLTSGTLIATINGTNIYAPSYTDADGVSY